jgi:hypothetical protein
MSTVFDEVEGRFFGAAASAVSAGARVGHLGWNAGPGGRRGGQGRAVMPARRGKP